MAIETEAELLEQLALLQKSKERASVFKSHFNNGIRVETPDIGELDKAIDNITAKLSSIRSGNSMSYSIPIFHHR